MAKKNTANNKEEEYLTTKQVATRLGKSPRTIQHWRHPKINRGPKWFSRGDGRILYRVSDVEHWEKRAFTMTPHCPPRL